MKTKLSLLALSICICFGSFAQIKKAAVISIYGNKNLSDDPLETKLYEALLNDTSFSITHTVNDFEKVIHEQVTKKFDFPFMTKEEVIENEDYKALESRNMRATNQDDDSSMTSIFGNLVNAPGYISISGFGLSKDNKLIDAAIAAFPEADAVMICYIDFNLADEAGAMGITSKKVYANANISMFGRDGKKIFRLRERSKSDGAVMGAMGIVTDPDKLKPMIESASNNLVEDLKGGKIDKKIAKMNKKLSKMK